MRDGEAERRNGEKGRHKREREGGRQIEREREINREKET